MPIKVTISGGIVLEKSIESIYFKVDTPNDSNARTTDIGNTLEITGRISTDESTVQIYSWSLIKPDKNNKQDVYRNVEVNITDQKNECIRKVIFPEAFVVDYSESYSNNAGAGIYSIYIKQKKDNNKNVEASGS